MPFYTHVRIVAYQVPTVWEKKARQFVCATDPGNDCGRSDKIVEGTGDDARKRLLRLVSVVNKAYRELYRMRLVGLDNESTLKIFVAPEFYFRPNYVSSGAYAYSAKDYLSIVKSLNALFPKDDFAEWLIIPGTIVWDEGGRGIHNDTICIVGEYEPKERLHNISKLMDSPIDGVPLSHITPPSLPKKHPTKAEHQAYLRKREEYNEKVREYQTFRSFAANEAFSKAHLLFGGMVGVDICLEHGANHQILRQAVANHAPPSNQNGVDVHVLIAGGMFLNPESVAAKAGGVVLRNDGMSALGMPPPAQLVNVNGYLGTDGAATPKPLYKQGVTATFDAEIAPLYREIFTSGKNEYLAAPADCPDMEQALLIYDSFPLP